MNEGQDKGPALPTLFFDSAALPGTQGLAIWAASAPYDWSLPPGAGPEQFRSRARAWRLDPLVITAGVQSAIRFDRTSDRIRSDARDNLCLFLARTADWRGDFDGLEVELPRGLIGVIDFSRPFTSESPDMEFVMISVPRPAVESVPGSADRHGRVLDGASGRLLADHLVALTRVLPETRADEAAAVADATMALVRSCLAHAPAREPGRAVASLRQRVRAYVNAHLTDAGLSPERVAEALAITRSTLYRAFPSAGVAAYIQTRRLEAIRALLETPGEARSLHDLAATFGFASHAHLTTAFGRHFGYPPSQARRGAKPEQRPAGTVAAFQSWISELDASAQASAHEVVEPRSGAERT